ncbi:winged helix-turn-helix domain-containing protein [Achromobacter aloeverae]|uniref:OmpR/PhoB-type domain-containing protein n=1 Tax=Achromobacter aloeverae TaxID=1750518 RepID=A0A4Q1HD74_9BURK|nr:winged helix-turn-helix domain-containing protein [Achromobacter aloeverae]RXN83836.1 hypothetical protein C7R54_26600 [Achromobacter aloeverae]
MTPDLRATVIQLDAGLRMINNALEHLRQHLEPRPQAGWRFSEEGWILATPDGRKLQLGNAERALLLALACHPTRQMTRDELVHAINDTLGSDHYNTAALSVMISRLRKKAAADGVDLPLHAVRGQGYALSTQIDTSQLAPQSNRDRQQ